MAVSEADAIAETQAGSSVYYLFQDNGNLTERVKEASMSGPTFVGTAKPNTPAALLVSGDKQLVLCLAEGDFLQDYVYNEQEDEWAPGGLLEAHVVARDGPEIAAAVDKSGRLFAFCLAESGALLVLSANSIGGTWGPPEMLSEARPAEKASIFATAVDGAVHAFYAHKDLSIHETVLAGSEWKDTQVEQTSGGSQKYNIAAAPSSEEGGGYTLQYSNDKNEVFTITGGTQMKLADITKEGTKKTSEAQAYYRQVTIIRRRRWCYGCRRVYCWC